MSFFKLMSENPLRKGMFAVQDEGSRFSVTKEPGEDVVCHRHARRVGVVTSAGALLCFIDPRVRKIRNEASSCPGIFSRTLRFYHVASSPGSPLPHLLDGHRKLVGRSAIPVAVRWRVQFILIFFILKLRSFSHF